MVKAVSVGAVDGEWVVDQWVWVEVEWAAWTLLLDLIRWNRKFVKYVKLARDWYRAKRCICG